MTTSAYIHIPFCDKICTYCDFCKRYPNQKIIDKYLDALENDIKEHIKTALSENARFLIQNLIDKIIMYNDKMEIILKTNSPDNKKDCFLFCTKNYLRPLFIFCVSSSE